MLLTLVEEVKSFKPHCKNTPKTQNLQYTCEYYCYHGCTSIYWGHVLCIIPGNWEFEATCVEQL